MYLRQDITKRALDHLGVFHPFFGITFLVRALPAPELGGRFVKITRPGD